MAQIGVITDNATPENGLSFLIDSLSQQYSVQLYPNLIVDETPELFITNIPGLVASLPAPSLLIATDVFPFLDVHQRSTLVGHVASAKMIFTYSMLAAEEISNLYQVKCCVQMPPVPTGDHLSSDYIIYDEEIPYDIIQFFPGEKFVKYRNYTDFGRAKLYLHKPRFKEYFNLKLCMAAGHGVPSITEDVGAIREFISKGDTLLPGGASNNQWIKAIKQNMRDHIVNARNVRNGASRFNQHSHIVDQIRKNVRSTKDNSELPKYAAMIKQEQQDRRQKAIREKNARTKTSEKPISLPVQKGQTKTPEKSQKSQVDNPASIFLTGGIGDIFALESYFSDDLRRNLTTIYYATHKRQYIQELFDSLPNYPNLKNHISVWDDFSNFWCFLHKIQCIQQIQNSNKNVPPEFYKAPDYGILPIFQQVKENKRPYTYSSFVKFNLAEIKFALPFKYITICPYTTDKRVHDRNFDDAEWKLVVDYLERHDLMGVVLHIGEETPPEHDRLINLINQTTLPEAVEVLKRSRGYIGIDSCLSVLAAKLFPASNILVKSNNSHLLQNQHIYYAPLQRFPFIGSVADKLPKVVINEIQLKHITLDVVQGLGDIFWIYQKISPYVDTIDLNVLVTCQDVVQQRSKEWLSLLPKIRKVNFKQVHFQEYERLANGKFSLADTVNTFINKQVAPYSCNRWLEEGTRLEDIDIGVKVETDVVLQSEPHKLPFDEYIMLYVSGATKQHGAQERGVWAMEEWIKLINAIYKKYEVNYPIVVIGASFDQEMVYEVMGQLAKHHYDIMSLIDLEPAKLIDVMKKSKLFIGFQSGLNIIADSLNVKQVMIYYHYLTKMMDTWCKKNHLGTMYFTGTFRDKPDKIVSGLPTNLFEER